MARIKDRTDWYTPDARARAGMTVFSLTSNAFNTLKKQTSKHLDFLPIPLIFCKQMSTPDVPLIGTIHAITEMAEDVRVVEVATTQPLPFIAGQYMRLSTTGEEARDFSIASAPHEPALTFHIRNSGHGFSARIFNGNLKAGDTLHLQGPMGTGMAVTLRPLLLLAGGVGIAPMRSIIIDHLQHKPDTSVTLYWGVRDRVHLYMHDFFNALMCTHKGFRYIPLVADTDTTPHGLRQGLAITGAAGDIADMQNYSIYMAGPRAMIEASLPLLMQKNAQKDYIFHDAF